jgi:hypothetical protein
MHGYLKDYLLIVNICRMSFFSRESHGRGNRGRGNWNRGPRRPRFSIHFDVDFEELGQLFHVGFFNWIGQGIVQPRPERPSFQSPQAPSIHVPPHVSLQPKVPKNDGRQEIVHPAVSQHHGVRKTGPQNNKIKNKKCGNKTQKIHNTIETHIYMVHRVWATSTREIARSFLYYYPANEGIQPTAKSVVTSSSFSHSLLSQNTIPAIMHSRNTFPS